MSNIASVHSLTLTFQDFFICGHYTCHYIAADARTGFKLAQNENKNEATLT